MGIIFKGSGFYSTDNRNGGSDGSRKERDREPAVSTKSDGDSKAAKESTTAAKEPSKKKD
jgi:hypothetical protein